jgi:hypothetical protein
MPPAPPCERLHVRHRVQTPKPPSAFSAGYVPTCLAENLGKAPTAHAGCMRSSTLAQGTRPRQGRQDLQQRRARLDRPLLFNRRPALGRRHLVLDGEMVVLKSPPRARRHVDTMATYVGSSSINATIHVPFAEVRERLTCTMSLARRVCIERPQRLNTFSIG